MTRSPVGISTERFLVVAAVSEDRDHGSGYEGKEESS